MVGLRDPMQISSLVLGVSPDVAYVLQFLDGIHSLEEIRREYRERFQREFPMESLQQVVQTLDQCYFLDNQSFRDYFKTLVDAFRHVEVREAFHAGVGYPSDAVSLSQFLSEHFRLPKGPGLPDNRAKETGLHGMIAPHIDLRIGGETYAWAYKRLAEGQRPDLVVILGTAHNGLRNLFSLARKRFSTPLGELALDSAFVDRLVSLYPYDLFSEEFSHRTEHTIEFQILYLQLVFGEGIPIVPILCSFAHPMVRQGESAEIIQTFADRLQKAIREDGRRICLIASADLAHVGPRYGDTEGFTGEALSHIQEADREMLAYAEKVDSEGFLNYISQEEDRRRICGLAPIYTLLKVLETEKGRLLAHDHGEMDTLGSVCSYASMVFE